MPHFNSIYIMNELCNTTFIILNGFERRLVFSHTFKIWRNFVIADVNIQETAHTHVLKIFVKSLQYSINSFCLLIDYVIKDESSGK